MKTIRSTGFPAQRPLAVFRPQLFVRPSTEVAGRRALAAAGISRRPAQLLASSGGTLWSPPFKPAVFARR
jgi:hypothetical protein